MNRLPRRLAQLYGGLLLYGVSAGLMVRAGLGLDPWDVFHQGVSERSGLSIGMVVNLTGLLVLLLWIPLRERPGLGTVSNVLLIGIVMDITMALVPDAGAPAVQVPLMLGAVALNGLATGLYISAEFGPGPRDGLMTALHRVTGRSTRLVRTGIEVTVLLAGIALGGTVGVGTVVYALAIGPLAQFFLRICAIPGTRSGMDFDDRRRRGILRLRSRRMARHHEPSCADVG
ncbi:YczE/YyaS/YitT family protein [Streptomyces sp. SBT349]|uniref:membrane protein YczE n=1 Tax=Streptomyces sp. SBT349 TaxID=1580539 RepID=UPI00066CB41F|nr:membrane protein [Streptomyces sp. SBT349]